MMRRALDVLLFLVAAASLFAGAFALAAERSPLPYVREYAAAQFINYCQPNRACSVSSLASTGNISMTSVAAHTITSATSATNMTSSVPAVDIIASATPDTNDKLACISYGGTPTRVACVDKEGDLSLTGGITATTSTYATNGSSSQLRLQDTGANKLWFMLQVNDSMKFLRDDAAQMAVFNNSGDVTLTRTFISSAGSGVNAFGVATNGARFDIGAGASDYLSSDGTTVTFAGPIKSAATQTRGTITLTLGTGTATVISGAVCVCSSTTVNIAYCSVSGTTLTATGTGTDAVSYICL